MQTPCFYKIMLMWYEIMHMFSYEHNIEHNRSKIRALHPKIIGKIYLEVNYMLI